MNINFNDPRIRTHQIDLNDGPDRQGNITIYFLGEVPVGVSWYEWSLDYKKFIKELEKAIPFTFRLINDDGGNGHYSADIEII